MKLARSLKKKRGRGRPANGATPILVRMPPEQLALLDNWIGQQNAEQSRPDAIRRLVELGLTVKSANGRETSKKTDRAAELASQVINEQMGGEASADQRASRTRRLLKGPSAFREVRKDRKQ